MAKTAVTKRSLNCGARGMNSPTTPRVGVARGLGMHYQNTGDFARAEQHLAQAEAHYDRLGYALDHIACALYRLPLALRAAQPDAVRIAERAAALRNAAAGVPDLEVQADLVLADCTLLDADSDRALTSLHSAARRVMLLHHGLLDPLFAGHVSQRYAHVIARGLALAEKRADAARKQLDQLTGTALRLRAARSHMIADPVPAHIVAQMRNDLRNFDAVYARFEEHALLRSTDAVAGWGGDAQRNHWQRWRARLAARHGQAWRAVSIEPLQVLADAWLLIHAVTLKRIAATPTAHHLLSLASLKDSTGRCRRPRVKRHWRRVCGPTRPY
jgi:hypothetical protein